MIQIIENREESCRSRVSTYRDKYPALRFAHNEDFSRIGVFSESKQDFESCAALGLDGQWYAVELDILVNGQPRPVKWIED